MILRLKERILRPAMKPERLVAGGTEVGPIGWTVWRLG